LPPPAFQGRQVLGRALTRMFSGGFEARGRRTSRKKRPDMFCYMTIYHKSPWKITSSINCTRISRQKYIHKRTMFIHFELSWIALLEHVKVSPDSDPPQHIKKRLLHITKRLLRCPSGTPSQQVGSLNEALRELPSTYTYIIKVKIMLKKSIICGTRSFENHDFSMAMWINRWACLIANWILCRLMWFGRFPTRCWVHRYRSYLSI
jgi:hypothetical protein